MISYILYNIIYLKRDLCEVCECGLSMVSILFIYLFIFNSRTIRRFHLYARHTRRVNTIIHTQYKSTLLHRLAINIYVYLYFITIFRREKDRNGRIYYYYNNIQWTCTTAAKHSNTKITFRYTNGYWKV